MWEVVLPPNANIVSSQWTAVCKHDQERAIRLKSGLVAQGFTQTFRVNYYKTYGPVAQLASLQALA